MSAPPKGPPHGAAITGAAITGAAITGAAMSGAAMPEFAMTGARPFPPRVSAFTRPFWDALAASRLITTRCTGCHTLSFPPRNLCRACWGRMLEWVPLEPHGRLYSFTRVHVVPGAFSADAPYAIGIVDLADGVRLMCRMIGDVVPAHLDGPVEMVVLRYDDGPLFGARVGAQHAVADRPGAS